jgi:hypothetical protein
MDCNLTQKQKSINPSKGRGKPVEMPGKTTNAKQQPGCACLPKIGRWLLVILFLIKRDL